MPFSGDAVRKAVCGVGGSALGLLAPLFIPIANYHKVSSLKQHTFVSWRFWKPENQAAGAPSRGCRAESAPLFSTFSPQLLERFVSSNPCLSFF